MEFPELGKHCSLVDCKQLDFLPADCDLCKKVFCKDHIGYEQHKCTEKYQKDRRVPVCPLCNQPISIKPGESPDRRVNEHIENDCKSDLAIAKRKTYTNRCSVKGCKQRELVPVTCGTCRRNYCLRHRHENDHVCVATTPSTGPTKSFASRAAGQAAAARIESYNTSRRPQAHQNSYASSTGSTSSSRQFGNQSNSRSNSQRSSAVQSHQGGMTEDEALAFALQASLADGQQSKSETHSSNADDADQDLALARAIAQSEIDERNRQRGTSQNRSDKGSSCSVT